MQVYEKPLFFSCLLTCHQPEQVRWSVPGWKLVPSGRALPDYMAEDMDKGTNEELWSQLRDL